MTVSWRWLAPDPPRRVPNERAWNVALRTLHLMAFGILLGGYFWGVEVDQLGPAFGITAATGASLMALELYKSFQWLFLGKGLMVLAKLVLLGVVPFAGEVRLAVLLSVVALASVGAHMPSRYRHYSILLRRVVSQESTTRA